MHGSVPSVVLSLLIPSIIEGSEVSTSSNRRLANVRQITGTDGQAIAIESIDGDYQDLWIAPFQDEEIEVLGYKIRGELFWIRAFPNGAKQLFALNTSYFDFDGLRPEARIDTFLSSIYLVWDEKGQVVDQPKQAEDFSCVESAEL